MLLQITAVTFNMTIDIEESFNFKIVSLVDMLC